VRRSREITLSSPPERTWSAIAAGGWRGPLRLAAGPAGYAGTLTAIDVDEDAQVVGAHARARQVGGWGGVVATLELRPALRGVEIAGDVELTGAAGEDAADALIDEVAERLRGVVEAEPEPSEPGPVAGALARVVRSPADDPAWRRRLAARAAAAVAIGAAVGLAGARWGRRR
jgi:hypothetical protein